MSRAADEISKVAHYDREAASADRSRMLLFFFVLVTVLSSSAIGSRAAAQDGFDEVERIEEEIHARTLVFDEANFDQWVFGGERDDQRIFSELALRVEAIDRVCELSEAQQAKLRLAGRGDIKRFMESVDALREKYMNVGQDQDKLNEMWREIQPLQSRINSGFFHDSCLLDKVIRNTLDSDQQARLRQVESERRRFRYQAKVALAVAILERGMPLRATQRKRFIELLLEETEPPLKSGPNDYNFVMYRMATLPEEKLRPIFDDVQWRALSKHLRRSGRLEQQFRREGLIK